MSERKDEWWLDWFSIRIAGAIVFAVFCWIGLGYFLPLWYSGYEVQAAGQFGDMFGAVNSFFSGVAFLAAIAAVFLQTVEMREAGERRVEEEKQQTKQMELTVEGLRLQRSLVDDHKAERIRNVLTEIIDGMTDLEIKVFVHLNYLGVGCHDLESNKEFMAARQMLSFDEMQFSIRRFLQKLTPAHFLFPDHSAALGEAMKQFANVIAEAFMEQPDGTPKPVPNVVEMGGMLNESRKAVANCVGQIWVDVGQGVTG